jgi:hypothetical protein
MKTVERPAAEPTLEEMVARAKTSHEHGRVEARLHHRIVEEERRLAVLEGAREQAALAGTTQRNNQDRRDAIETIASLQIALAAASKRRDEAETREIEQAMEDGAKAAHAMSPELKEAYMAFATALESVLTAIDKVKAKTAEMNDLQAHAIRRMQQDGTTRAIVCHPLAVRAAAAELVQRPVLGAAASGPHSQLDNIALRSKVVVEAVNNFGVHMDDPFLQRRSNVLVDIRAQKTAEGASTVDAVGMSGRLRGTGAG